MSVSDTIDTWLNEARSEVALEATYVKGYVVPQDRTIQVVRDLLKDLAKAVSVPKPSIHMDEDVSVSWTFPKHVVSIETDDEEGVCEYWVVRKAGPGQRVNAKRDVTGGEFCEEGPEREAAIRALLKAFPSA